MSLITAGEAAQPATANRASQTAAILRLSNSLCDHFGTSLDWLLLGNGEMFRSGWGDRIKPAPRKRYRKVSEKVIEGPWGCKAPR